MNNERPNILYITSDQHRWDAIGAYDQVPVSTPHLDQLAADGVLFDRAYCVNPLCAPSRLSMITSLYPSRHGVYTLGVQPTREFTQTVGALLSQSGYATGLLGKAHFEPCTSGDGVEAPPKALDLDRFRQWHGPYFGFDHVELAQGHTHCVIRDAKGDGHLPLHYGAWLEDKGVDATQYWGRKGQGYCAIGEWNIPEDIHPSTWIAERTINFIDSAVGAGKPFFAFASFQDPHNPVVVPEPWYSMYDRDKMPDYTYREGENDDKPYFYQTFIDTAHYGDVPPNGLNGFPCSGRQLVKGEKHAVDHPGMEEKARRQEAVAVYYGMISLMDDRIGRIISHLKDRGLYENTLIVFSSDHGEYLGNHGLWWKGLQAFEDCHRVPFLASWPAGMAGGRASSALQSLVDLAPTFLAAAGVEIPADYQGVNQLPVWTGDTDTARDWAMVEFRPNDTDFYQKVLITEQHKIVTYHGESYGELYDLKEDPDQYCNLWDLAEYQSLKTTLLLKMLDAAIDSEPKRQPRTAHA